MKIKNTILAIVSIGCVIILITSYLVWQARIESVANNASARNHSTEIVKEEKSDEQEPNEEEEVEGKLNLESLTGLIQNLDESSKQVILNRFEQQENVQMLVLGSEALNMGEPGYAEILQTNIQSSYGDFMEVDVVPFDGSVTEFQEQIEDVDVDWQKGYDLVLFEPFTVNNNGVVIVEDAFETILSINEFIQTEVSDAQLILQPSYPIYNSVYYPVEVNALKEYSLANGIPFIDHWTEWPGITDEQLQTYFSEDRTTVNSKGANLWANTLSSYFISK
ncbi:MAG: SGNH/GDSL hydrolase family protein [Firmicutes bacterium]|nr:SGNH/GDSL hydrolase family protein [Bacillota bacterium]